MLLIGITGKARSGKDTLADILFTHHEFTPTAFAGPLKEACMSAFDEDWDNFTTQEGKASINTYWDMTRRKILQDFGECMCKTFGEDFWIKRWMIDYADLDHTDHIVVTDVRKDIEANAIRGLGGVIVQLQRDGAGLAGTEAQHVTEQGVTLLKGDVIVRNNGTIEELRATASKIVAYAKGRQHGQS